MARTMSETNDRPEPLFFVNDVLNGFFRQGVLLDTLLEDAGFSAKKIRFLVKIADDPAITFECQDDDYCFKQIEDETVVNDVLVGIPGGAIGCHGLYAFFENALRNAVKYGAKDLQYPQKFILEVYLNLIKCKGKWLLRISDNISKDKINAKGELVTQRIRKLQDKDILGEGSQETSEGHGIQEMKVCAENLARTGNAKLVFSDDRSFLSNREGNDCCIFCTEYKKYLNRTDTTITKIEKSHALRCYSTGELLTYNIILPSPKLISIFNSVLKDPPDFIHQANDIAAITQSGAHFGIVLGQETLDIANIRKIIQDIANVHNALPYRLMIIVKSGQKKQWIEQITSLESRENNQPFKKGRIPKRRVKIIGDDNLHELLSKGPPTETIKEYLSAQGWHAIVLKIYDAWLREYKPLPEGESSWNLCVGFEEIPMVLLLSGKRM